MTKIGLFDSGVGGLTVLRELQHAYPQASYVYFGDTKKSPYGSKTKEEIVAHSLEVARFLIEKEQVDILIIACNTATAYALTPLKELFSIPIFGIIDPLCSKLEKHPPTSIGLLATKATVTSKVYEERLSPYHTFTATPCPRFVPLIEKGITDPEILLPVIQSYLKEIKKKSPKKVILGCTHYPLLAPLVQEVLGEEIELLNPALALINTLKTCIQPAEEKQDTFYVSSNPKQFQRLAHRILEDKAPLYVLLENTSPT